MEEVTSYFDSGYPVDVICLDFQKAFDKVPHHRLQMKLQAHCIGRNVLQWIGNWLSGRKVKGKVFPYSLPSVGPGADPGVQAVSPQVT